MFTTEHFIWLGICVFLIAVLTFVSLRFKFSFRTSAFIMAGVSLASEVAKILSHMEFVNESKPEKGMVIDADSLPLHLCSMLIFAFFYLPFAKNEKIKKFLLSFIVPIGIIGSMSAILMATSGTRFNAPYAYQCFIYHAVMVWFAIYIIVTKSAELGIRACGRNMGVLFFMMVIMIWVNGALQEYNTNFWYVVRPPAKNLPLLNLDNGWYVYILSLMLCGFVGVTVVHLPFIIKELAEKKKAHK